MAQKRFPFEADYKKFRLFYETAGAEMEALCKLLMSLKLRRITFCQNIYQVELTSIEDAIIW